MNFSGILLAGGKSTRFGINKIKMESEGIPLLAAQVIKLSFFCSEIIISSSRENFRYIRYVLDRMDEYWKILLNSKSGKVDAVSLSANNKSFVPSGNIWEKPVTRIVVDDEDTRPDGKSIGPLAGIYSGLKEAENKNCLVLASDMPFVSYRVLRLLTRTSEETGKDAVIIRNPKGIEALCGIYSKEYIKQMKTCIKNEIYKISEILEDREVEWIDSTKLREEKIDIYNFFNINTRDDIKKFNIIRKKGIPGLNTDLGGLKGGSRNIWETFFYRGMDRKS